MDIREGTIWTFCAAAYPSGKRKILAALNPTTANLDAAWCPGFPVPCTSHADDFVGLRLKEIPRDIVQEVITEIPEIVKHVPESLSAQP